MTDKKSKKRPKKQVTEQHKKNVIDHFIHRPETYAASTMIHTTTNMYGMRKYLDHELTKVSLYKLGNKIIQGDDEDLQRLLITQAESTNALFHEMVYRMHNVEYMDHLKIFGDLSLKFQNQSRRTIATLADIRNPKQATFIKQANVAQNQQINHGTSPENNSQSENELSEEVSNVEALDDRTAEAAGGLDSQMEALGEVHGAKVPRG